MEKSKHISSFEEVTKFHGHVCPEQQSDTEQLKL